LKSFAIPWEDLAQLFCSNKSMSTATEVLQKYLAAEMAVLDG